MTDIVTYVVVFGLLIAGVIVYQVRYGKPRPHWLSHQVFPDLKLWILVEKKDGKHKFLIIRTQQDNNIKTYTPFVELINTSREKLKVEIPNINPQISKTPENKTTFEYKYDFATFSKVLKNNYFKFSTFKISVENNKGQMYKSH
ncbi:MAG: hypothetical protein C0595_10030 [Marinilabiliales bacterium]|nr:MAG: hypothetical protein C0595_10030 [Marinilabiliales bacterium]